ncbi:bifunctional 4-hydroxy-2-oxoglutarate aldolase/2-dehydro-3-deoxy-phosphogluconate aldolase [Phycicoccus sp. Soil802]|uniref:bifunctional 4-hydroxy-2-oxoglutarate aldolase/2-dehydro-3-deoxy-phosphogluconate aldolase n=1 Tax=Phycicoccus sp. Soil802 TaxID=1736414 RepID=UPI000703C188|nr:bifunctional 4-hydroxy-2-oxoglutarate aldolase/2-dehydro-3-deoxy-phosphogluconate aldolase [Phycicoccus sp. Soil802]KRF22348.1 aldolase [Phycicoccus sp. Soil802]
MNLLDRVREQKLVAIVRGRDAEASVSTCLTLADEGIRLIEVSLTTRDAFRVIESVASRLDGETALGAGTVLTADDVRRVRDCGARYIVTPALAPSIEAAHSHDLPVLAGALTPSEVVQAANHGAAAVKLFPASVFGPAYVKALRDPFPDVPLLPVGGVELQHVAAYLSAGATGVGIGSPLCGDAPHGGDLEALRQRARLFMAAVR